MSNLMPCGLSQNMKIQTLKKHNKYKYTLVSHFWGHDFIWSFASIL